MHSAVNDILALALLALLSADAYAQRIQEPRRTLVYANDPWLVWTERTDINNRTRAVRFHTEYFLQELGSDMAPRAHYEMHGTYSKDVLAVLDDRTLILGYSTVIDWVTPQGDVRSQRLALDGVEAHALQGYVDGLLIQPRRLNEDAPIFFVPIVRNELDFSQRIKITDDDGTSVNSPQHFLRAGSRIAYDHFLFDLDRKVLSEFDTDKHVQVMAMDEQTLVFYSESGHTALSLIDGTRRIIDEPNGKLLRDARIWAVHNHVAYFFSRTPMESKEAILMAIDLTADPLESREFTRFVPPVTLNAAYHMRPRIPLAKSKEGLWIWEEAGPRLIEWLDKIE